MKIEGIDTRLRSIANSDERAHTSTNAEQFAARLVE